MLLARALLMLWLDERGWLGERFSVSKWRFLLPVMLVFLSWMMVSEVRYPSFKSLDLRATRTFTKTLVAILFIGLIVVLREKILVFVLPVIFSAYLIYGFIRPHVTRRIRHEIEEEETDEEPAPPR